MRRRHPGTVSAPLVDGHFDSVLRNQYDGALAGDQFVAVELGASIVIFGRRALDLDKNRRI
jgi:hypothetical protein